MYNPSMLKKFTAVVLAALLQGSPQTQAPPTAVVWSGDLGKRPATVALVGMRYVQPGETVADVRRAIWDGFRGRSYESWWPSD